MSVRGRVVNVRPRGDGRYAVTLVCGERAYAWRVHEEPLKLGSLVDVTGASVRRYDHAGGKEATVSVLEGGRLEVVPDKYTRRYVHPLWQKAAQRATSRRLYPHQLEGAGWVAERLSARQGCLLADDQGLGKTIQVLCGLLVAHALPAIVVCPSSLKLNWEREVNYLRVPLRTTILDGRTGPIEPAHVVILNYELLRTRESQLMRLGSRCIVFDEAQELKNPDAAASHRASVATRLSRAIGLRVLMTGTPMPNRPQELWRLLHIVSPHAWPDFENFRQRYCLAPEEEELRPGRELVTTHGRVYHLDELRVRMAPMVLRRLKTEVLDELPPKRRRSIAVELSATDRQHYDRARDDMLAWLRSIGRIVPRSSEHGQALVKLTLLRKLAAIGKLRSAIPDYLHRYFAGGAEPLVIFGFHKVVRRGTRAICERMGLRVGGIGSQDPPERRQRSIDRLDAGELDVFLAPIKAAGVGINLQSASHMLFLERLYVPSAMVQAEDRCHRIGQTRPVHIDYLDAIDTVDEQIAAVLAAKQRLIDAVVDDAEKVDADAADEVIRAMTR